MAGIASAGRHRTLDVAQPATVTEYLTSYTNSISVTISASVGFKGDGPTGSVGVSATVGNSWSVSVPPFTILNNSINPLPAWSYERQNTAGNTFDPQTGWLWTVPWGTYNDGGQGSTGRLQLVSQIGMGGDFVSSVACSAPYPFEGILEVDPRASRASTSPTCCQAAGS